MNYKFIYPNSKKIMKCPVYCVPRPQYTFNIDIVLVIKSRL